MTRRNHATSRRRRVRLGVFGLAEDTGNSGVSALAHSLLAAIAKQTHTEFDVTMFDHGTGCRPAAWTTPDGPLRFERCGAVLSRRPARLESYWHVRLAERMHLPNPTLKAVQACDVILDGSGGDSFSDLYGPRRFRAICESKLLALRLGKPLLLLPQTYGPFNDPAHAKTARQIVCRASGAWSRDDRGFDALRALTGDVFDPHRHRAGVDLAFALPSIPPTHGISLALQRALRHDVTRPPRIGINVSGLLYDTNRHALGVSMDYPELVRSLIRRVLHRTSARVMLVPSVMPDGARSSFESDLEACYAARESTEPALRDRVLVVEGVTEPEHIKWVVSHCDWFVGSRMHATIAALSSHVPTVGLAYSDKFVGVFESVGAGAGVLDLRTMSTSETLDETWRQWCERERNQVRLLDTVDDTISRAHEQMAEILAWCAGHTRSREIAA